MCHILYAEVASGIQIVSGQQQLQAKFGRNVHVLDTSRVPVLLVVIKILDYLLKYDASDRLKVTDPCHGFVEIACALSLMTGRFNR